MNWSAYFVETNLPFPRILSVVSPFSKNTLRTRNPYKRCAHCQRNSAVSIGVQANSGNKIFVGWVEDSRNPIVMLMRFPSLTASYVTNAQSQPAASAGQLHSAVRHPFPWLICISTPICLFLVFTVLETPGFQAEKKISSALDCDQ